MHHPWARLWQKAKPGWMRAEQQIRRAHPSGDRNEHRQYDGRRLSEGETQRRSQERRSARCCEDGCKKPLEKRAGVACKSRPAEQSARDTLGQCNFKHTEQIERKDEDDHAPRENKIRIGELKAAPR